MVKQTYLLFSGIDLGNMVPFSTDPIFLAAQLRNFVKLMEQLQSEVLILSTRVSEVELENLSLRKFLNENKV